MYDVDVVDSLVNIEIKILFSFNKLSFYYNDKIEFNKELAFLNTVLFKKEELLISKLPTYDEAIINIFDDISDGKNIFFENEFQSYFVMQRIQSIFDDLIIAIDDSVYSDDDYELDDSPKIRKIIKDNLSIKFIGKIFGSISENTDVYNYLINIIFMDIYCSKKNSNYICKRKFDFNNLPVVSDEMMRRKFDLDLEDFSSVKKDEIYTILEDLTFNLLEVASVDEDSPALFYLIMRFKFLINLLDDSQFDVFKTYFLNSVKPLNDLYYISRFISLLDEETKKRGFNSLEKNKKAPKIEEDNLDDFINLIKLEGKIYELYRIIDFNNYDYDIICSLQSLIYVESDLLKKIVIDKNNESVYRRLIEEDLSFFFSMDEDGISMISKRLYNILPYFNNLDVSPTQSVSCFNYIKQNHIIRSLKKYINLLDEKKSFCDITYLKDFIYLNGFLTFDFSVTNGNYKLIEDLSDGILCQILDMNYMEYEFDKNEQLIRRADEIICEIVISEDENDICFKLLELQDIKENLNDEYLCKLNEEIIPSDFKFNKSINKVMVKLMKK